jgi:hypothetical protein
VCRRTGRSAGATAGISPPRWLRSTGTTFRGRGGELLDPAQERARKDRALAIRTELQNDIARGRAVLIDDVVGRVTEEYAVVRTRLLALPSKIAGRVPPDARNIVFSVADDEIRQALEELSADEAAP